MCLVWFLVNPFEVLMPSVGHGKPYITGPAPGERRGRGRFRVHWPIILFRNQSGEDTVKTITQNLSSQGFYCLSRKPYTVGELLFCTLQIPTTDPGGRETYLECRVQVVRVEEVAENAADGQYGIACRIEDYCFVARHGARIFPAAGLPIHTGEDSAIPRKGHLLDSGIRRE